MTITSVNFVPVLVMLGFAVGLAGVISLLTHILGRKKKNPVKQDVYECGVPIITPGRTRFSIHFYLVAILFLLFDFETVVLLPWAVVYKKLLGMNILDMGILFPLATVLVFLFILIIGFIYEVKKGAMKWE